MLAEVVRQAGLRFGDQAAVVSADGWSYSYRQLDHASDEVAAWLSRRHHVSTSTVAAIVLPSSVDYLVFYAALAKLGAVTAGVNPHLTARERGAAMATCGPDLVIADADLVDGIPASAAVIRHTLAQAAEEVCTGNRLRDED